MAIVPMADAVPGAIASSAEYNKIIDNVIDLDSRLIQAARGITATTGDVTSNSSTFASASQTLLWQTTFTSEGTDRWYAMNINSGWTMSAGTATYTLRYITGAGTPTSSSTQAFIWREAPGTPSGFNRLTVGIPWVAGFPAGLITIGLFGQSDGPSDGVLLGAANNPRRWSIADVGN